MAFNVKARGLNRPFEQRIRVGDGVDVHAPAGLQVRVGRALDNVHGRRSVRPSRPHGDDFPVDGDQDTFRQHVNQRFDSRSASGTGPRRRVITLSLNFSSGAPVTFPAVHQVIPSHDGTQRLTVAHKITGRLCEIVRPARHRATRVRQRGHQIRFPHQQLGRQSKTPAG